MKKCSENCLEVLCIQASRITTFLKYQLGILFFFNKMNKAELCELEDTYFLLARLSLGRTLGTTAVPGEGVTARNTGSPENPPQVSHT